MTIDTITMDPGAAKLAYREYQAAVRAERSGVRTQWKAEDLALAQGYKALAKGQRLLNVRQAMRTAGLRVSDGYPRLAICRSDFPRVQVTMGWTGGVTFGPVIGGGRWGRTRKDERVDFPDGTFSTAEPQRGERVSTLVPIIPPNLRPKTKLDGFHTLWEVESWTLEPPRDPILLRHLGGDLYTVLAVWDLTDLERAVLSGLARG
jgi:hypothetical protein